MKAPLLVELFTEELPPRALQKLALIPAIRDMFDFSYEDIAIEGYDPAPAIKAPVAV